MGLISSKWIRSKWLSCFRKKVGFQENLLPERSKTRSFLGDAEAKRRSKRLEVRELPQRVVDVVVCQEELIQLGKRREILRDESDTAGLGQPEASPAHCSSG